MVLGGGKRLRRRFGNLLSTAPRLEQLEDRLVPSSPEQSLLQMPLSFEANVGQTDAQVQYLARGPGYALFLTPEEAVLNLSSADTTSVLRARFVGANPNPQAMGLDLQPSTSNYFIGNDPSRWHADVSLYSRVRYHEVYPGIDVIYYGTSQRQLEYDFVVAAGADPSVIKINFEGADSMNLDAGGNLILHTEAGNVVQHAPVIYQEVGGGRQLVNGSFQLENNQVGFHLGVYDSSLPLVIDPVLVYSTYLGGSPGESAQAVATDAAGNVYVTGYVQSANFPVMGAIDSTLGGTSDAFVTKLNAAGTAWVYSTYLGGSGRENDISTFNGYAAIAVDAAGSAYVTGVTFSADFPTVSPFQPNLNGGQDAFVAKLNPSGNNLLYSTFLGGSGNEQGKAIAVDTSGNAYVTGSTGSPDFPLIAGAFQSTNTTTGAFVTKLDAAGASLVFSTYLGGSSTDAGNGIKLDSSNNVYIVGYTQSNNFPTTAGLDRTLGGASDAFVAKLDANGANLLWATYLGGSNREIDLVQDEAGIALDSSGNVFVASGTNSTDFPVTSPYQATNAGGWDAFVTKLNGSTGATIYSTYLGGTVNDIALALAVTPAGEACVTGFTQSADFPTWNPLDGTLGNSRDCFITVLNAAGSGLVFSTYLGGAGGFSGDYGHGIAVDSLGLLYVVGYTDCGDYPTLAAAQTPYGGAGDAFIAKISLPTIQITETSGTNVTETGIRDTYTIVLATLPTGNVIVTVNPDAQQTVAVSTLTFTPANWNVAQTVQLNAVDDLVAEGLHTSILQHTASSTDAGYNGIAIANVTADIVDNDTAGVTIAQTAGTTNVGEGAASDTYTVVFTSQPAADVTITFTPGTQVSVVPATLTFTAANWSTLQTVTVTALDDFIVEGAHTDTITATATSTDTFYNGIAITTVTTGITDNDTGGVVITQSGGSTNITEGAATDTYTVVLTALPTANVLVTLAPDAQVTVSIGVLTFTAATWNVAQTVTVTAVDDIVSQGPHIGVITHTSSSADATFNGLAIAGITANITDDDVAGVGITPSGGATNLSESGATDSYTAVLFTQPVANVTVTFTPDSQLSVSAAILTFTPANWNTLQTVTVMAVDDSIAQGLHSGVVSHSAASADSAYNALSIAALTAAIADNDVAGVTFGPSGGSTNVTEGSTTDTYTIVLTSQPTANVAISLDPGTQLSVSSTTLTFTAGNWNVPRTITVTASDDPIAEGIHAGTIAHTVASADPSYNSSATLTASIADNDVPGVTLSSTSFTVLENTSRSYTVVLNTPPLADVIVALNPGPLLAVVPSTWTFTPTNWSVPQPVLVTAVDDSLIQGNHANTITHSASSGDAAYNGVAIATVTANIIDNDGTIIDGTPNPDRILITNSSDLSMIDVRVNGKLTSYPGTLTELIVNSGGGADSIQIANPRVHVVIVGGQQSDTVLIVGQTAANAYSLDDASLDLNGTQVDLFEIENLIAAGNRGDDTFAVQNTPLFNVEFRGDQGNDQLLGSDRANTWKILNPNGGTLNNNIKFSAVENLTGGASTDGFFFSAGRTLAGMIDGAGGSNALDYSLYSSAVAVNLQTNRATAVKSFQNLDRFVGGRSSADKLVGMDQVNLWNITNLNSGDVGGVSFQHIENLVGGQQDDTFRLGDNRGLKGKIDGAGGTNHLDYGSYLSASVIINLQSRQATNLGGFSNLHRFQGGVGVDTLIGPNLLLNLWNVSGTNTGDVNGTGFLGFENLTGGSKNDLFNIDTLGDWSGILSGSTGLDSLLASTGRTNTWTATTLNGRRFQTIEVRR